MKSVDKLLFQSFAYTLFFWFNDSKQAVFVL